MLLCPECGTPLGDDDRLTNPAPFMSDTYSCPMCGIWRRVFYDEQTDEEEYELEQEREAERAELQYWEDTEGEGRPIIL